MRVSVSRSRLIKKNKKMSHLGLMNMKTRDRKHVAREMVMNDNINAKVTVIKNNKDDLK